MTTIRPLLVLTIAITAIWGSALPAGASPTPAPTTTSVLARDYLRAHPGGVLRAGNEVVYPDGSGFVAGDIGTKSLGECASGRFCMWSSASYTGSFTYVTGSGVTKPLTQTVRSFWNNRSQAARLYDNAGTSSTCYGAGVKKSAVAVSYQSPAKVLLASGASC